MHIFEKSNPKNMSGLPKVFLKSGTKRTITGVFHIKADFISTYYL